MFLGEEPCIKSNKTKAILFGVIVLLCCFLEYYFYFILKTSVFNSDLFFIPIILAAFWWGLSGGLITSLFFGLIYLLRGFLSASVSISDSAVLERFLIFVVIGLLSGLFGEERKKLFVRLDKIKNQLAKSGEELKDWGKVLEERIQAKTEELFTLYKISKETSSTMDMKMLLKKVLEMTIPIIEADIGAILLLDFEGFSKCWEKRGCGNKNCPAFKSSNFKCWSMLSPDSSSLQTIDLKRKMKRCIKCEVFRNLELKPIVSRGLSKRVENNFCVRIGESFWGEAILKSRPVFEEVRDISDNFDLVKIYLNNLRRMDFKILKNLHKVQDPNFKKLKESNLEFDEEVIIPKTHITLPLITEGEIMGVLYLANMESRHYGEEEINMLSTVADRVAVAIENAQLHKETKLLTITDDLTGISNYRHFQEQLRSELRRADRYHRPLSLIILDIDDFKKYNDSYGHWAGNLALKCLAILLEENVREKIDIVARYGGEEFCLILPETDKGAAMEVAERIRHSVEENDFDKEEMGIGSKLTVSLGVATYPDDTKESEDLVMKADVALYQAKEAGRNQICSYLTEG